jgi:hypothetical protein
MDKDDVMKVFVQTFFVSLLMIVAAPAWSDSALHIVTCSQDENTSDAQVEKAAAAWLKAARTVKGGENLKLYLNFPVAAKAGDVDYAFILVAPSFAEWGTFMDSYAGSAAEAVDGKHEGEMDCGDGALWESLEIK